MHAVIDAIQDTLPATRTYARRAWHWLPADPSHPAWDGRSGTLTITLQKGKGCRCKVEQDTYAVESDDGPRAWLLLNLTDDSQEDVYRVSLDPRDRHPCTCKAGVCGLACKHHDTLKALVSVGAL